ncbi:MAG: hypothetical protein ACM3ZE_23665, partial [Myxococcales bacterium]
MPRLVPGLDIRQLPIGPEEAFVLSRVDGQTTAREIGYATSLTEEQVTRHLERLQSLGAIVFAEPAALVSTYPEARRNQGNSSNPLPPSPTRSTSNSVERAAPRVRPAPNVTPHPQSVPPSRNSPGPAENNARLYAPQELEAAADLELTRKQEILELYYRLDSLDHYALLA